MNIITSSSLRPSGASYYGVSDPETMANNNTHKFKKSYIEGLIGNLDRHKDRYVTRSPLRKYERLEVPMIFFHGAKDKVRPVLRVCGLQGEYSTGRMQRCVLFCKINNNGNNNHVNLMNVMNKIVIVNFYSTLHLHF